MSVGQMSVGQKLRHQVRDIKVDCNVLGNKVKNIVGYYGPQPFMWETTSTLMS